jgi:nickel-dependent lactate racemase
VRAVAGDVHAAFRSGVQLVDRMFKVDVPAPVDMVVCSPGGYPKDINLYQAQKAIRTARRIVRRDGVIVALAECREGHGSDTAYEWALEARSPQDIIERTRRCFVMGGHKAYQLAVDVQWAAVHLHSSLPDEVASAFFLCPLTTVDQVYALAKDSRTIAVLPQATLTLPMLAGQGMVSF